MLEESLRIRKKRFGNEHAIVAQSLNNLAELYLAQVGLLNNQFAVEKTS